MKLIIDPAESLLTHMSVNLGGRYLAVTEHELNRPQIRPSFQ